MIGPEFEFQVPEGASGVQIAHGAKVLMDGHALPGVRDFSVRYEPNSVALVTVTFIARRVRITSGAER